MELAKLKARHGATMVSDGLILGLDTVVLMNGKIIEKTVLQIPRITTLQCYQIPFDSYNTL